jgi:hypothetical protein
VIFCGRSCMAYDSADQVGSEAGRDWSWDKSRTRGTKTKNPSIKAWASRLLPAYIRRAIIANTISAVQIFERKMTFARGRRRPALGLGRPGTSPSEPVGPGGQSRSLPNGTNLFAIDKARLSNVSKAIFCASITSPATRQPWGTKHQPTLRRPVSSSS